MNKMVQKPEIKEKIKKDMEDIVNGVVEKYAGTVPPSFLPGETPPAEKTPE